MNTTFTTQNSSLWGKLSGALLKSIFISLILVLGTTNAWGYTISSAKIYYDDSNSKWGSNVVVAFDKNDGGAVFAMTKINNTSLHYWTGSWGDGGVSYMRFGKTDQTYDWYGWWTNVGSTWDLSTTDSWSGVSNGWGLDINNAYKMFGANSNSSGADLTKTDLTSYTDLNYTQTVQQHLSTDGGSNYSASTTALATVKVSSYTLNSKNTTTSSSGTIASGSSSTTCSAARTATVTYTVTDVQSGYTFVGWYDGTTQESTNTTYTYNATAAKTITARFKQEAVEPSISISTEKTYLRTAYDKLILDIDYSNIPEGYTYRVHATPEAYFNGNENGDNVDRVSISGNGNTTFVSHGYLAQNQYTVEVILWNNGGATNIKSNQISIIVESQLSVQTRARFNNQINTTAAEHPQPEWVHPSQNVGETITASEPKPGYTFAGWTANDDNLIKFDNPNSLTTIVKSKVNGNNNAVAYANYTRVETYAFIQGRFHVTNAERNQWTNTFDNGNWDENSKKIKFDYDEVNSQFYLHTYATPKELTNQISNYNPYFYIKTSTSSSSLTNATPYWSSSKQYIIEAGKENKKELTNSSSNVVNSNLRFNTQDESGYVILYFDQQYIWYELEHKLEYDANGGTGSAPSRTYHLKGSTTTTASDNIFTRDGYDFQGWNTKADGTGNQYEAEANITIEANTTLYAQWAKPTFTVTLDPQGGTGGSSSVEATYGEKMPEATMPQREGFTFGGYFTETNGGGTQYYNADGSSTRSWDIKDSKTLYAKWIQQYVIVGNGKGSWLNGANWIESVIADASFDVTKQSSNIIDGSVTYSACPAGLKNFRIVPWGTWGTNHGKEQLTSCNVPSYTNEDNNIAFVTVAEADITIGFDGTNITVQVDYDAEDLADVKAEVVADTKRMFYFGDEWIHNNVQEDPYRYHKYVNEDETTTHLVTETKGFKTNVGGTDKYLAVAILPAARYSISNRFDWNGVSTGEVVQAGAIYAWYGNQVMGKTAGTPPTLGDASIRVGTANSGLTASAGGSSIGQAQIITDYYYYQLEGGNTWTKFDQNNVSDLPVGIYKVHALAHDGNIYVRTTEPATLTIYDDYTIIYKDQGGSAFTGTHEADYPAIHLYGQTTELKSATKTGYTFDGWFTSPDCTGEPITTLGATDYTADITLYAKWTEITYAVIINAVGNGTVSPNGEQQVGAGGLSVTATPDAGYIVKWNTTGGAMVSSTTDNEITVTANAEGTVTANFEESPLDTIYFVNKNGWENVKVHLWGGTETGTTWPGIDAQKADFQLQCRDVYYVTALPGSYANCIFSDNGSNQTADLVWTEGAGKYYYNGAWKTLDELTYEVQLAGSMLVNNGNWVLQDMTVDANNTNSITVSLEANTTYDFKIIVDGNWYGNTGTMTYGNSTGWTMSTSDGNCKITTAEAGNYIFTYDVCTAKLTVTYPAFVTLSDGASEAVSWSQTRATLTSVPGQMVTATPTMGIGANGNTFCWKLYDKDQAINNLETTVDVNFISLGDGKITFELPKVTGTYYLQLTIHAGADCSDETLIETIICPIDVSTENTVFFQDESGNWKNVYVYFYGEGGYWGTDSDWDKGSGAREVNSYKMTKINGTNIFYYKYSFDISSKNIAFTDHNQGNGQGDDGKGYQWFSSCQVVYRSDFASCAPMFVLDKSHGVHHNNTAYYYTDGYWTTYMGTSSGYWLHIDGNGVADPSHEMTTTTVGKRVYTHKVSLNGNQTPYNLWFGGCNGTNYGVESNMTVTNCTEWNLYSGSASVNLYATAAGDYTFILYCNPDGHFQLSVEFPVAEGDFQLVYDDEQQTPHPSDYIRSSTIDGKLDTVSMYIRGENGTGKTLKVQRCTGFDNGNPQWTTLKTYDDAHFSGLNLTKDTVYNFHMEQTVSTQTIDIKSTEFYSGKYYVRTKAADGGWDAYATESDNQMTYTEYSSHLPFDPYTHYFCKWVDDSNKDDVSYTIACDYAKALSDTLEGDNYTTTPESHALPEKANVRFTYDNRTNGLKRAYLTGASDSDFDDFLKLTKTKDGTTMKPGENASDVSHVKLQDEENWVYATEIYVTSAESDGGGYSFDAMLTAVYPKSAVNDPAKKQYFFAKKNDNGTYAGETLIGGTDGSEQLVTIRYDFKTNRLMRAWKPSGDIDDEELPLSADILLIREGQNAAEQLVFTDPTNNKITNVKTIFGALEFKYDNMVGKLGTGNWNQTSYHYCRYYVSFPFDVRISEIFGAGNYGEDYIIQKYNGTKRAEIGWFAETETFWETMDKSETLYKYEGYCVMLNRTPFNDGNSHVWKNKKTGSSVYLYFPSASHKDDWTINAIGDVVIPIPEHQCNIDRDFTQDVQQGKNPPRNHKNTDSHWNMVGTPLFQNATAAKIADGPEVEEGDGYAEQGTRLQYVYDWVNTAEIPNGTAARKAWGTDFEFKAMHSYLIQFAGEVTFRGSHIANHVPSSVAARRAAEEVKNYTVELQLDRDSAFASRTYVELQENAVDSFLLNEDMYMGSSSPIANLYTYAGAYDVAANVLSVNSHIVPVGVQVKQAGTYTFSMTTPFDGTVTLIDYHTGARTNLGWSNYTITLEKGTLNDRFALEINIQNVSTDVEGNTGHFKGKDAVKFLHNGILYIKKGDAIYDARGSRVSMSYEL